MERVLELLRVPCPNAGCSETFAFAETSTHVKLCPFTQPTCPFTSCDFTCSFKDLYEHCGYAKHCEDSYMFECGMPVFIHPVSGTAKFSYDLHMYSSSGDSCLFQSKLKRVREVSNEPPCKHVMLVHSSMCPDYKFYICIKQETY
ncbi:hypothetical protein HID58_062255 [Brassica napus]|uniref:RING-type E3 ubiquitin transferase n=2 Tax=Brassica TaxID=3705 RepID=A0ABQ8A0W4_BRANA|nr:hypothetical protein HID58_062255 [Brassica napus]